MELKALFSVKKPLLGMVHLLPLPGSPSYGGDLGVILERALEDGQTLRAGGAHGLVIENFGDLPFLPGRVEAITVAAMTRVVSEVRRSVDLPCGVSVLRNDAEAALSIATATGSSFIRVGIHIGAMVTDQGIIQGRAHKTLRLRSQLGVPLKIFADLQVKHAHPLGTPDPEREARDLTGRGLADAVVVSGVATGEPADLEVVDQIKSAIPETPVLVGSGVCEENVEATLKVADGAIVGTHLKEGGLIDRPVDQARVEALVRKGRSVPLSS